MKDEQKELLNNINTETSLTDIQEYIRKVIELRGFEDETPEKLMLQMLEEVGELAKALRKELGYKIDVSKIGKYGNVSNEIADVFIFLLSLCNTLNISVFEALVHKEEENVDRKWNK